MKRFKIKIKGTTPLMHHRMDDAVLLSLTGSKTVRKKDKVEETPRDIAQRHTYTVGGKFVVPTVQIIGAFKSVASEYKQKNSARKSVKSIAGGIFRPEHEFEPIMDQKGKPIKGFEVDIRRGVNPNGHQTIAIVRPRYDQWSLEMTALVDTELVSEDTFLEILNDAGRRSGIGSFRVSKGGYYGTFNVTSFEQIK